MRFFATFVVVWRITAALGAVHNNENNNERIQEFVSAMDELAAENDAQAKLQQQLWNVARRSLSDSSSSSSSSSSSASLDLTKYALKYVGCQNIHTWNDNAALYENSPLVMNRFVVFRLCEASSCSAYNKHGCNANFGEYLIPMEEYLTLMYTYHEQQFNYYCTICDACMSYGAAGTDDKATTSNDDASSSKKVDDYYKDDLTFDDQYYGRRTAQSYGDDKYKYNNKNNNNYGSSGNYIDSNGKCIFTTVCNQYQQACKNEPDLKTGIEQYFQCSALTMGNSVSYVGPHCKSDGRTIGLGVYDDSSCDQYAGDTINLSRYLQYNQSAMAQYYGKSCIPCAAENAYSLLTDAQVSAKEYVYPLCAALYDTAAKCQKHLSDTSTSMYQVTMVVSRVLKRLHLHCYLPCCFALLL
jgi:hypothetical protein